MGLMLNLYISAWLTSLTCQAASGSGVHGTCLPQGEPGHDGPVLTLYEHEKKKGLGIQRIALILDPIR